MIKRIDQFLDDLSKWGVSLCIVIMLCLTLINIVLRWFETSVLWIEPLVRHIVFIAAFLGGSLATGAKHHIKIDLMARILEASKNYRLKLILEKVVGVATLIAVMTLTYASMNLASIEFEFGHKSFLNIHSGYLLSIIPAGMALISVRVFLNLLMKGYK